MHVLFITSNKKFLDETSEEAARLRAMVAAAETLHVVVCTRRRDGYTLKKIAETAWIYPTNSLFSWTSAWSALRVIRRQVIWQGEFRAHVIHSDDPYLAGWLGLWLARRWERAWVINLHTFYWEFDSIPRALAARIRLVPVSWILAYATHICVFSERVRIYMDDAAKPADQHKILSFQKSYDPAALRRAPVTIDLKKKYPAYHFVILVAAPLHAGVRIGMALNVLARLHEVAGYGNAGMVVVGHGPLKSLYELRAKTRGMGAWVQFESSAEDLVSYFKTTNLLLYLASGEEEDENTITAAAVGCAIVGLPSSLMTSIIRDSENGIIVHDTSENGMVAAIRRYNELPGLRERFKANSAAYLGSTFERSDQSLVQEFQKAWEYEEAPLEELHLDHTPSFGPSKTPAASLASRMRSQWYKLTSKK